MMSLPKIITNHKKITGLILAILAVLVVLLVSSGRGDNQAAGESATTSTGTLQQVELLDTARSEEKITASGEVQARLQATVAAEASGVLSRVPVEIGDRVSEGQILATFSNADQRAALESAEAQLAKLKNGARPEELANSELAQEQSEVSLEDAQDSLKDIRQQQDENVQDAEENLLNTDLQAYLADSDVSSRSSLAQPTITGTYQSSERGVYRVDVYSSGSNSGASFRLSGLEAGLGTVSTESPQRLGNRGLFIQFPENFSKSSNVQWVVEIPNQRSTGYTAAKNAYEKAKQVRDEAIRKAEVAVETARKNSQQSENSLSIAREGARAEDIAVGEAQVAGARAGLAKTIVRAPFSGTVLSLSATAGEYKNPGQAIAKLLDENSLEIRVFVSDENAAKIAVGDMVQVEDTYEAEVVAVAPAIDADTGSVEVRLRLPQNTEITVGSFVDVLFPASSDDRIIGALNLLPLAAVGTNGAGSFVLVVGEDAVLEEQAIETGAVVGDSIEILGGLSEERVVANISGLKAGQEVTLKQNTSNE